MTGKPVEKGPSIFTAFSLIMSMQVSVLLKRKRLLFLVIILLLPPFISLMMKVASRDAMEAWYAFVPQAYLIFLVPILSLFHGASAVADEVDDRTLGYMLMKPITRDVLISAKVSAGVLVTSLLTSFSLGLSHQIIYWDGNFDSLWAHGRALQLLQVIGLTTWASFVYTTFAAILSLKLKRPTLVGILYIVFIEVACCYAPGPLARVAMTTHFMRLMPDVFPRVEVIIAEGTSQEPHSANAVAAMGLLLMVTGILVCLMLRHFRRFDLSGADTGDQ